MALISRAAVFITSLAAAASNVALAEAPLSQVRQAMQEQSVPQWKKAAAEIHQRRANPPNPFFKSHWEALDGEAREPTGRAALTKASSPRDTAELLASTLWLRWKILTDNADGRHSYVYSFNIRNMQGPNGSYAGEAVVFLLHARLSLAIDGARCANPAGVDSVIAGYESQGPLRPLVEAIDRMPPRDRAQAMLEAIAIEEMRGERPPVLWLCTSVDQSPGQARNRDRQAENGNLIPAKRWQKLRREILDRDIAAAAKAL